MPLDDETRGREMLDVCGTGGDKLGTFNISTTVAIAAAAAGVTVVNRQSGDYLQIRQCRRAGRAGHPDRADSGTGGRRPDHGFAFIFAPGYHPAFKHIMPAQAVRRAGPAHGVQFPRATAQPGATHGAALHRRAQGRTVRADRPLQSIGIRRGMVSTAA